MLRKLAWNLKKKGKKYLTLIKHTMYLRPTTRHIVIKLLDFKEEKMPQPFQQKQQLIYKGKKTRSPSNFCATSALWQKKAE